MREWWDPSSGKPSQNPTSRGRGGREVSFDIDCKIPPDLKMLNCFREGLLDLGKLIIVLNLKVTLRVQPSVFIEEEKKESLHFYQPEANPYC